MEISNPHVWLPQQPPILMLDRAWIDEPGRTGTAYRYFSKDDSLFVGHFPTRPILPGIYMIEALAQTAMLVLLAGACRDPPARREPGFLAKVDKTGFYHVVEPDREIAFSVRVTRKVGRFYMVYGEAKEEDILCVKSNLTIATAEENPSASNP